MAGRLKNEGELVDQNQGCELAHPNLHPISALLKHVKEPVLQTQSCRISMMQGNNSISKRSPRKGPASIMKQTPETSNETNDFLQ